MTSAIDSDKSTEPQRIVANEITIVDRAGKPRIRLLVEEDGAPAIQLIDKAEQLRVALYLKEADGDDEAGLVIADSNRMTGARLEVGHSAMMGSRAQLEVIEVVGSKRKTHAFPVRPRPSDD